MGFINNFKKMQSFNLSQIEVYQMLKKSVVVDVKEKSWPNGEPIYLIRKRSL